MSVCLDGISCNSANSWRSTCTVLDWTNSLPNHPTRQSQNKNGQIAILLLNCIGTPAKRWHNLCPNKFTTVMPEKKLQNLNRVQSISSWALCSLQKPMGQLLSRPNSAIVIIPLHLTSLLLQSFNALLPDFLSLDSLQPANKKIIRETPERTLRQKRTQFNLIWASALIQTWIPS